VSTLEKELDELIAREENVSPEDVTLEFIRKKRDEEVYPKAPVNLTMPHGGFVARARRFLTHLEGKALVTRGNRFLAKFSVPK
jgi:hypothetical protein